MRACGFWVYWLLLTTPLCVGTFSWEKTETLPHSMIHVLCGCSIPFMCAESNLFTVAPWHHLLGTKVKKDLDAWLLRQRHRRHDHLWRYESWLRKLVWSSGIMNLIGNDWAVGLLFIVHQPPAWKYEYHLAFHYLHRWWVFSFLPFLTMPQWEEDVLSPLKGCGLWGKRHYLKKWLNVQSSVDHFCGCFQGI